MGSGGCSSETWHWVFVFEAILRIAVLFFVLLLSMRMMGKRMASQLARNELAALVSLAGAVGPALQEPKNGLLPSIIAAGVIVAMQLLTARVVKRLPSLERVVQGEATVLVQSGVIELDGLKRAALSRQRVISALRSESILNLGRVERLALEMNGAFTVLERQHATPGLSLVPQWDEELWDAQEKAPEVMVCSNCGRARGQSPCVCGAASYERAVTT